MNEALRLAADERTPASFTDGDVYFIGNATTLIRFAGLTILTDPAFLHKGNHVDLGHGICARREVEPGLSSLGSTTAGSDRALASRWRWLAESSRAS
jgi:hypothetical protein